MVNIANSSSTYQYNNKGWNINQLFSISLQTKIDLKDSYAQMGDLRGWLNMLGIIYRKVHGHSKANKDKLDEINKLMKKTTIRLNRLPDNMMMTLTMPQKEDFNRAKKLIIEADTILMDELYNMKLVFPDEKKDNKFAGLEIQ